MSFLSLNGITLRFGGLHALKDVSFEVEKGEIFSVIGPNGAGKTSLFNVLTGIYPPTEGTVLLEEKPLAGPLTGKVVARIFGVGIFAAVGTVLLFNAQSLFQTAIVDRYQYLQPFLWSESIRAIFEFLGAAPLSDTVVPGLFALLCGAAGTLVAWLRSRCGSETVAHCGLSRTFQNIRLFNDLSVLDNIRVSIDTRYRSSLLSSAFRLPGFYKLRDTKIDAAKEILRFVGLEQFCDREASSLSYGDQRRLEIGRALGRNPKVLLLDEPAAGMNPTEAAGLMDLIKSIRDRGITVLLIEHHMKVVMGVSDRVAVLDYGHKIAEGTPQQISADPRVIEAYLGKGAA